MDVIGDKLFGSVKSRGGPVFEMDSVWKKKILYNAAHHYNENPDVLQALVDTVVTDCYECLFRKLSGDKVPRDTTVNPVREDKQTSTDPVVIEDRKGEVNRIIELNNQCEALKTQVKELTKEKDMESYLRKGSESSYEMMKEEYIRVTKALKEKYAHDIQEVRDMSLKRNNEKMRDMQEMSIKLEQAAAERNSCLQKLSDQLFKVEICEKKIQALSDEKVVMRNQFESRCGELEIEKNQLEDEAARLDALLSLVKKNYCEKLKAKDDKYRTQAEILKRHEESMVELSKENKVLQKDLKDTRKKLESVKCCAQETELNLRNEIDKLLSSLQKEKDSVKKHDQMNELLDGKNCTLEVALEGALNEMESLKDETLNLQKVIDDLLLTKNNLDKKLQAKDDALKIKLKLVESHEKTMELLSNENKLAEDNLGNLKETLRTLQNDLEKEHMHCIELKNDLDSLKNRSTHENDVNLREEIQNLQLNLQEQTKTVLENEKVIEALQNDNKVLKDEFENSQSNLQKHKDTALEHEKVIESLQNNNKALKDELENSQSNLQKQKHTALEHEKVIESLHNENKAIKDELENSQSNLQKQNRTVLEHEKIIESLQKQKLSFLEHEKVIEDLHNVNNALKDENENLQSNLQKQTKAVLEYEKVIESLHNDNKALKDKLENLQSNLQKQNLTVLEHEKMNESQHKDNKALQDELENLKSHLQKQNNTVLEHETVIESLENDNKALQDEIETLKKEIITGNSEVLKLQQEFAHLSSVTNDLKEELKLKEVTLAEDKELIKTHEEQIEMINNERRVTEDRLAIAITELDARTHELQSERANLMTFKNQLNTMKNMKITHDSKLQKELEVLKSDLQKETSTSQQYKEIIESLNNESCRKLSIANTENKLLKVQVLDLKTEIVDLVSSVSDLRDEHRTRDIQLESLNTDVLDMRNELELTLELTKGMMRKYQSDNSKRDSEYAKQVDEDVKGTVEEIENLIIKQQMQNIEILQAKLKNTEYELELLKHSKEIESEENKETEESISKFSESWDWTGSSEHSNVSDEVRVELAALRREIAERQGAEEKFREVFEQEKQQLQKSVKVEKQKNEKILEAMEGVVHSFEQKIIQAKAMIREEKSKNKKLVKILTKAGILVMKNGETKLGQGDYSDSV